MSTFAALRPLGIGRRPIEARALVLFRAAPERARELLPAGKLPTLVQGRALIGLCYTRLGGLSTRWLHLGSGSDHLSFRVAVTDGTSGVEGWWALRRATSSWLEARCGERLSPCDYRHASFRLEEGPFGMELGVVSSRGEELYLRAEASPRLRDSVFGSPAEVRDFLGRIGGVEPADLFCPEADGLDVEGLAPEPLVPFGVRSSLLSSGAAIEFDSAFRLVTRRLAPARARSTSRLRRMIEPANPALTS